jgi:hypothetical protein
LVFSSCFVDEYLIYPSPTMLHLDHAWSPRVATVMLIRHLVSHNLLKTSSGMVIDCCRKAQLTNHQV